MFITSQVADRWRAAQTVGPLPIQNDESPLILAVILVCL